MKNKFYQEYKNKINSKSCDLILDRESRFISTAI